MNINSRSFLFLLLVLLHFGCAPGSGPADSADIDFKRTDNTVYARLPAEPDRLNPILSTNTYARVINELLFLNLLHFNPQTLELEPQLAKARPLVEEVNEGLYTGGVAYTFELHDEAVWDNGQPITAQDFVFTLKALLNPKVNAAHVRAYLDFIKNVSIDPDNPKKFTVYSDGKYIIGETVVSNIPLMPEHRYDPEGLLRPFSLEAMTDPEQAARLADSNPALQAFADAFNSPQYSREAAFIAGSGPYAFEGWTTGQQIVLNKKDNWWGEGLAKTYPLLRAHPDKLVFKIIPDQTAALAALKDEQIDVTSQIDAKDFVDLQANESVTDRYALHTPPSMVYYYIGINNKAPKLADRRVRRALAHLVNVDELIETLFYGLGKRTVGPFHPTKPYYHSELPLIEYSPEKARSLLAEAGWEDSNGNGIVDKTISGQLTELELEIMVSSGSKFANNQALLFQSNAKLAGIKINIAPKEFTVLIDQSKQRNYELYSGAWAQDPIVDDPKQLWHSDSDTPSGSNRVSFSHPEADRLIDEIRETLDEQRRNALYLQFQEVIYQEQPYIFLFSPLERIAISKRFDAQASARRPGFFVNDFVLRQAKAQ